jgi:hypothetical protein
MAEFTDKKMFDRRGFLKGSALFAAAALGIAASMTPAFAQDPAAPASKPEESKKKDDEKKDGADGKDKDAGKGASEQPKQPAGQQAAQQQDPNKLYDKSGREYRVCERCGGNMYKEGNTWTCEQCGLSYTE